jgi:integrase
MPRRTNGSIYRTASGVGIRWPEGGRRIHQDGFRNVTEARRWFTSNVSPRLDRGGAPNPDVTFDAFCELFLARHGATVSDRTRKTLGERLAPSRRMFGDWTLAELEGAADDVARWRATLAPTSRYRLTLALRQVLGAAQRWGYIDRNPAVDAGRNPEPRAEELLPFTPDGITALALELGPLYGPLVVFAAETGLRTNEWAALERRDLDRAGLAVTVQRRFAGGVLTRIRRRSARPAASRSAVAPWPRSTRSRPGSIRRSCSPPLVAITSGSTRGARASGIRRSTLPNSNVVGRTSYATRSRPRRSRPVSRSSS